MPHRHWRQDLVAAVEPANFAKSAAGIFSQRIGIHYRLLFSLDPSKEELIVQELIHRRDLEKAVKHYAATSSR